MKHIYYSLASGGNTDRERQLVSSVRSLRRHNRHVTVFAFLYGDVAGETRRALDRNNIWVVQLKDYGAYLRRLYPRIWRPLSRYPVLHKWLSLAELPRSEISQLLYVDCDTYFRRDVDQLFRRYLLHDWYAREEPLTRRSRWGYDPGYVNERALGRLATVEALWT